MNFDFSDDQQAINENRPQWNARWNKTVER